MRVPCFCKRYLVNPENATYVKDGVPMCNAATCDKLKEHREDMALRRVPYFDETEADRVAEPYGKNARYIDI